MPAKTSPISVMLTLIVDRMTEDAVESNAHCAMLR